MRQVTVTEKYRAVLEGNMAKGEFVRQMRLAHPQHITQFNGFDDSVQILKNRGLLFEIKKEVVEELDEWDSRIFQHEYDHLDGRLFIEYASDFKLQRAIKKRDKLLKKFSQARK